jgi:hypothetical protein
LLPYIEQNLSRNFGDERFVVKLYLTQFKLNPMRKIFTPLIIAFVLALLSSFVKPSTHVQSASKAYIAAANRTLP